MCFQGHIAAAHCDYTVGQLQQLQNMLGVGQNLLQHLLRFIRVIAAEYNLLNLRELVHPVQAAHIASRRADLAAEAG
ncbi:hypothetical protein D3C80_1923540 [compost metagenome]